MIYQRSSKCHLSLQVTIELLKFKHHIMMFILICLFSSIEIVYNGEMNSEIYYEEVN